MSKARWSPKPITDTVDFNSNGSLVVDVEKLFNKDHIRRMLQEIRSKTRVVTVDRSNKRNPAAPEL